MCIRDRSSYGLNDYDADVLVANREQSNFFDEVVKYTENYKKAANWVIVEVVAALNKANIKEMCIRDRPWHVLIMKVKELWRMSMLSTKKD